MVKRNTHATDKGKQKVGGDALAKIKAEEKEIAERKMGSLFYFKGIDGADYKINLRQKLFVECYLINGAVGMQAIIDAGYDVNYKDKDGNDTGRPNYKLAAVMASENLVKPNISAYINANLERFGYSDKNVERQHLFIMNQTGNLDVKARGIDMFYKIKGTYAPTRIDARTTMVSPFDDLEEDDIIEEAQIIEGKK